MQCCWAGRWFGQGGGASRTGAGHARHLLRPQPGGGRLVGRLDAGEHRHTLSVRDHCQGYPGKQSLLWSIVIKNLCIQAWDSVVIAYFLFFVVVAIDRSGKSGQEEEEEERERNMFGLGSRTRSDT